MENNNSQGFYGLYNFSIMGELFIVNEFIHDFFDVFIPF